MVMSVGEWIKGTTSAGKNILGQMHCQLDQLYCCLGQ